MTPEHIGPLALAAFIITLMIAAYISNRNDKNN